MTLLSRIRKWFELLPSIMRGHYKVTNSPHQQLMYDLSRFYILPTHEDWDAILVRESLRRSGGNVAAAAKAIGRSEGDVRKMAKP